MARLYAAEDAIEPISDTFAEIVGNQATYNVVSGCDLTYDAADMTVDLAAGAITFDGSIVDVAVAANGFTVVSDPSNPRWTWLALSSAGAPVVVSGDAGATPTVPELGDRVPLALLLVQANQTIAANITYKLDQRVPSPPQPMTKYKSGTQVFTGDTAFADITASSGTFTFTMAAGDIWVARYVLPLTYGGTGGVKLQLTGPSGPTLVRVDSWGYITQGNDSSGATEGAVWFPGGSATAFSSSFMARDSAASAGTAGTLLNGTATVEAFIVNGSTAGDVTLQGAQNSSNSTTTFAAGSNMVATRLRSA